MDISIGREYLVDLSLTEIETIFHPKEWKRLRDARRLEQVRQSVIKHRLKRERNKLYKQKQRLEQEICSDLQKIKQMLEQEKQELKKEIGMFKSMGVNI